MKKIFCILSIIIGMFLSGCSVEKKVIIRNSDPDKLFLRAQELYKKEMPAAKMEVDINQRILKVVDSDNIDYPNYIEMRFDKNLGNTDVTVIADGDEKKLKNLEYLLNENLKKQQFLGGMSDSINNIKGHQVMNEKDRQMDKNNDGWVGPKEIMMKKFANMKDGAN
ncbi:MAG: hypothetical protein A2Y40_00705 [Candidatus Margulisbacteria bacterium GWF2_35_9]|nr:MAG: hypothetical protein A2Y40_00705 [Candidatus Margulisbacteria bacterium GWF2_35_9]